MNEKLSILTELIKLARADNQIKNEEYKFLHAMTRLLKIDKSQLDTLFTKYIDFTPPPLEVDRILQFQRLVLLANVDLEIVSTEIEMLKEAGLRLGLNSDAIENVIIEMKKHKNGIVPTNRLIEIYKVYHN